MKFIASLKIVELALEHVDASDTKRRTELETLRDEIFYSKRQPQSIFERLPVEVQTEIFSLVMTSRKPNIQSLVLVCRTWKDLIYGTPILWRRLTFNFDWRTTQEMADTWFERTTGIVRSLRVGYIPETDRNLDKFKNAPEDFWSKLEDLELAVENLTQSLPTEIIRKLRLRSIRVSDFGSFSAIKPWGSICMLDTSNTRVLSINVVNDLMDLRDFAFSKLTKLELAGGFQSEPFFRLLRKNPALEVLVIKNPDYYGGFDQEMEPIHLPFLKRVELIWGGYAFVGILHNMRIPNLGVFRLNSPFAHDAGECIEQLLSQNITGIHEIYIHECSVSSDTVVSLLRSSPSLTNLTLSKCTIDKDIDNGINQVVNALSKPASEPGNTRSSSLPCPKLRYLNLSTSRYLEPHALKRFIKSRLQDSSVASENESPSNTVQSNLAQDQVVPIAYLNVDDCDRIDSHTLEWLRNAIPYVSAEMTPTKYRWGSRRYRA